jgi:hypothetical protein
MLISCSITTIKKKGQTMKSETIQKIRTVSYVAEKQFFSKQFVTLIIK